MYNNNQKRGVGFMSENEKQDYTTSDAFTQSPQAENAYRTVTMEAPNKGNTVLGIVGALLGACIGGGLWLLISRFGYIAGIVGFITIFLSYKGYELLSKKKIDKIGVVIGLIFTILAIFVAEIFSVGIEVYKQINEMFDYSFKSSMSDAWQLILHDSEVKGAFIKDLIVGYIFTIVASFAYIRGLVKGQNK